MTARELSNKSQFRLLWVIPMRRMTHKQSDNFRQWRPGSYTNFADQRTDSAAHQHCIRIYLGPEFRHGPNYYTCVARITLTTDVVPRRGVFPRCSRWRLPDLIISALFPARMHGEQRVSTINDLTLSAGTVSSIYSCRISGPG